MLHLGKDEGVCAGAVLHDVLLTLGGNHCSQQVGKVDKSQRQEVTHVTKEG